MTLLLLQREFLDEIINKQPKLLSRNNGEILAVSFSNEKSRLLKEKKKKIKRIVVDMWLSKRVNELESH